MIRLNKSKREACGVRRRERAFGDFVLSNFLCPHVFQLRVGSRAKARTARAGKQRRECAQAWGGSSVGWFQALAGRG
jgi:hypothetical protein